MHVAEVDSFLHAFTVYGATTLTQDERDTYVAQVGEVAARLGVVDPPRTEAELDERMAEDWFDPHGFFLAVRGPQVIGFHWTKQHQDQLGEVYVLGVDPSAGGGGLGKVLLARGLTHLQQAGNTEVVLYVEADHERAVGLYRGYGFRVASRDVMYEQPDSTPAH